MRQVGALLVGRPLGRYRNGDLELEAEGQAICSFGDQTHWGVLRAGRRAPVSVLRLHHRSGGFGLLADDGDMNALRARARLQPSG
jgi:hypothetical protein